MAQAVLRPGFQRVTKGMPQVQQCSLAVFKGSAATMRRLHSSACAKACRKERLHGITCPAARSHDIGQSVQRGQALAAS